MPILQRCAYLFSTETELEMLCGLSLPESLDFLLNAGVALVIVKMGGRGARLVGRRVDLYVPPLPAEVVDVTGAGDLFAAGFLAAMIEQAGLESAGRLAAWAASRGISGLGRSAYPDAAAWRERLAEERGEAESVARQERLVRIGWLSTGRDQAASNLLSDVVARAQQDDVPLDIGAVFCDRERGEAPESDRFLDLVDRLGIPAVTLSSRASWAEAQKLGVSRAAWRDEYHRGVAELLIPLPPRRAGPGRVHAHRQPGPVPQVRHPQPAPGAARRPQGHVAAGHLGAPRERRRRDGRHDPPRHGAAGPRTRRQHLPLLAARPRLGRRCGSSSAPSARP